MRCISCKRDHDLSTRLTGDVILCPCGAQLLVRHGHGTTTLAALGRQPEPEHQGPVGDEGFVTLIPQRSSGMYLTAGQLYALACRSFDFWHERSASGSCYQVHHNGQVIAEVATPAKARAVIVERFKALLKGGE